MEQHHTRSQHASMNQPPKAFCDQNSMHDTPDHGERLHGSQGSSPICWMNTSTTDAGAASTSISASSMSSKSTNPDPLLTEGEMVMVREMEQLTAAERENLYDDIHGVPRTIEEHSDHVEKCLEELDDYLSIINRERDAYDRALFLNAAFCKSRSFRVMFLRSDEFDPYKAACRILKHFQMKQRLFGVDNLVKKIHWDDLSADDQASIETGAVQLFADRKDRSGRPIYFITYAKRNDRCIENHMRCAWYLTMSALQDNEDAQRKGLVAVSYTVGMSSAEFCTIMAMESSHMIIDCLPVLAKSAHICFEDSKLKPFFSMLMMAGPKEIRLRIRIHYGSHLECQYALNTFGIPSSVVPIHVDGSIRMEDFQRRLTTLKDAEKRERNLKAMLNHDFIPHPNAKDVLLGRGVPYQSHPGTAKLMKLVEDLKPQHDSASRIDKRRICLEVVALVKSNGGRFLRREDHDNGWVEVDDNTSREKVAMGFRNLSRKGKAKNITARKKK